MNKYLTVLMKVFLWGVAVVFSSCALADMQGLSDTALAQATGQDGIAMQINFNLNTGSDGQPLSNLGAGCSACILAIQGANRPNLWLVFKDIYGYLSIPNLMIDEQNNPGGSSPYADPARFGASGVGQGLPTIMLRFHTGTVGDCSASATSCDINMFLNVGAVSLEYGSTGYLNNSNGSFMGLRVSDLSGAYAPARMNFDGQVRIYGF